MNDTDRVTGRIPVCLNLGMGVESSTLLARYLLEPASRDFDLADLVVLTAMTGDEFEDTRTCVVDHLLPLLRAAGVRYVQIARASAGRTGRADGNVVVLSDTYVSDRLFLEGAYKLSDELLAAGTVPTTAGDRLCSIHAKGEPLDEWIARDLGDPTRPFRHLIGFNADETGRADDDRAAAAKRKAKGELPGRRPEFPLIEWGWNRERCKDYLRAAFGVEWPKSCCSYCPFSRGKPEIRARFRAYPDRAADAAFLETVALALNPRMTLYAGAKTVPDLLAEDGNTEALRLLADRLANASWAVYRVRRIFFGKARADRHLGVLFRGTRAECEARVRELAARRGADAREERGYRAWLSSRPEKSRRPGKRAGADALTHWERTEAERASGVEECLVACPAIPMEKSARGWTEEKWEARVALTMATAGTGCAA